jgi:hypothetical protein
MMIYMDVLLLFYECVTRKEEGQSGTWMLDYCSCGEL